MAVRKICRQKGCRASPRCEHPWWFDIMHGGKRWRMRVDDFALARGATEPIASKQTFDEDGWEWMLPTWTEERRNYQLKQEEVRCLRGSLLPEAYEIVRQGALSDVPLPPWPATP